VLRVVADLGNSRLKWARVDERGRLVETIAMPVDKPAAWASAWEEWSRIDLEASASRWAVSTVNPPVAAKFRAFLDANGVSHVTWYDSAARVPVKHELENAETAGADRALAVAAALELMPKGRPGLVVSCGTALTIERITEVGTWQGGIIAPGLGTAARALHLLTAQLPMVEIRQPPPIWGRSTRPALEAGVFWGMVGAVRELLTRQTDDMGGIPSVFWTGGDAELLARQVAGSDARIEPDLVLLGLARVAFVPT
jgi:type III pantothenate kinase